MKYYEIPGRSGNNGRQVYIMTTYGRLVYEHNNPGSKGTSGSEEEAVVLVYSEGKYLSSDRGCHAFIQPLSELDYYKSPPGY